MADAPTKRTDKRTETHTCDYISRQAAIKALRKGKPKETEYRGSCADSCGIGKLLQYESDISAVIALPSAQPEIIRCKECKYWFDIDDGRQKHRMCADFFGEWFCADAERRTDERSN